MILLAVDGLEWKVLLPLLKAGRLPAFEKLMERGSFGHLKSGSPSFSPVLWTTAATGKRPRRHGIRHFTYDDRTGEKPVKRYYTSGHRTTKAIWNIFTDYQLAVHFVGWWMTYPAEAVHGTMVSQTNTSAVLHDAKRALWKGSLLKGIEGQVYPVGYQNDVMEILDETNRSLDVLTEEVYGVRPHPTTELSQREWDQTLWAFRADETYLSVAKDILRRGEEFDLIAVYVGGPDVVGHRFWRYAFPKMFDNPPAPEQIENFGQVVANTYEHVDRSLAELVDLAPPETTFLVVSDHGMHAANLAGEFRTDDGPRHTNSGNHTDSPPGVMIAAGPNIRKGSPPRPWTIDRMPLPGSLLDLTPTILALKGVPVGEDFDGAPMAKIFAEGWLEEHPLRVVATHDTDEWLASQKSRQVDAVDELERLEQLRSLGYID
jgi:predicted AlkP superfamily pyrophosphatase or phosphodiesterase